MGANCCVAAKDKPLLDMARFEASAYRNARHSPSWSFMRDNRTHIEDNMDNPTQYPHNYNGVAVSEIVSGAATDTEGLSDDGSPLNLAEKSFKSPTKTGYSDQSIGSDLSLEGKDTQKSSCSASASDAKTLISVSSPSSVALKANPSSSTFKENPSSSSSSSLISGPTSSQKARHSPGCSQSEQIFDSKLSSLKSLNDNSSPEGRQSFVLSVCSNDLPEGPQGGSSDGWSLRTFTEIVASCHRERRSFESENLSFKNSKMSGVGTLQPAPLSPGQQTCGICSKLLKDWSIADAVLACGHVYHAHCLENITPAADIYDPPCPMCSHGRKSAVKIFRKIGSRCKNKISRIVVSDEDASRQKRFSKGPRLGASSSMKSSFRGPTMRRHFSMGWRSRSVSESESSRKRSFWGIY